MHRHERFDETTSEPPDPALQQTVDRPTYSFISRGSQSDSDGR